MSKGYFFKGTLLLTSAGLLSRIMGFFIEYSCHILLVQKESVSISWLFHYSSLSLS